MSALQSCLWFASKADAKRDVFAAALNVYSDNYALLLLPVPGPRPTRHAGEFRSIDVTGRSLQHVDRLARDWISHGVAPTKDGGRGVAPVPCPKHVTSYMAALNPRLFEKAREATEAYQRWRRAEARARRVVRR